MKNSWLWNSDFIVFKRKDEQLVLKNDINGALVSLSLPEYEVLLAYSRKNSLPYVRSCLKDMQIAEDVFHRIIDKAKGLDLLIEKGIDKQQKRHHGGQIKLFYLGSKFAHILHTISGIKIMAECRGNLRFFKIFSIDLDKSCWQRIALSKTVQGIYWPLLGGLYLALIALLWHPAARFTFSGFALTEIPAMGLFLAMVISIFACLFCHEMGHYFVYKRFQGEGDIIGLGTMFMVFPVLYTQIDDSCLWDKRGKRMLLSLAGLVMDGLILLLLSNLLCFYHEINFLSLLMACLFYYYVVQIISNLNPFFPGTDGYYLMEDALGLQRWYGYSYECAAACWQSIRHGKWPRMSLRESIASVYFCLAALCISVYWLLITALLTFPLWSNLLLHSV